MAALVPVTAQRWRQQLFLPAWRRPRPTVHTRPTTSCTLGYGTRPTCCSRVCPQCASPLALRVEQSRCESARALVGGWVLCDQWAEVTRGGDGDGDGDGDGNGDGDWDGDGCALISVDDQAVVKAGCDERTGAHRRNEPCRVCSANQTYTKPSLLVPSVAMQCQPVDPSEVCTQIDVPLCDA